MELSLVFSKVIGLFLRWIIEYQCTFNKEKLKELKKDEKGKNLWYSVGFYVVLFVIMIVWLCGFGE